MASGNKNIKIVTKLGSFDVKLENLSGKAEPRIVDGKEIEMKPDGTPKIYYRDSKGNPLSFCRVLEGKPIPSTSNGYVNEATGELTQDKLPYYKTIDEEFIPAIKNQKTDVFEVTKWEDVSCYTNKYIIEKYYQVKPASGKSKQDYQRIACINANTQGMKQVYDYMMANSVVGKGILNITSSGFLPSIGYLRAIKINGTKWSMEIGVFKQQKSFTFVEEISFTPKKVSKPIVPNNTPHIQEI